MAFPIILFTFMNTTMVYFDLIFTQMKDATQPQHFSMCLKLSGLLCLFLFLLFKAV